MAATLNLSSALLPKASLFSPSSKPLIVNVSPKKVSRVVPVKAGSEKFDSPSDKGNETPADWDVAWKAFSKKRGKKSNPFSAMEKYVTRNPEQSKYPLIEEVDQFRKTEKMVLSFWTDTKFTYAGFGVVIGIMMYMVVIVGPPQA